MTGPALAETKTLDPMLLENKEGRMRGRRESEGKPEEKGKGHAVKKRRERRSAGGRRGLILALSGPHKTTRKTESGSERDGGQKVVTEAATAPTAPEKKVPIAPRPGGGWMSGRGRGRECVCLCL
ncbi:uncharacterized protein APUU_11478S [Aspergillus puulaauensis]|uniref:Uncharacterized protein n=1 Tax=Aspergillus puulaauensis TaxID=1220207 RepID=A0A7R7XCA9_9EURO|nr:uncharacterized protein APUU_11478S [Aspergillus puulaauensis]BCS18650.1 hypothetical protein APUU_11478S [Aspergillus puulaauensis]